ncbi:ankyrin repeat-containing domain protein [Plectosphaerella plurivora]|uniref:Ankyrin repeat-containing domain protein n=1 Tax=Plectosphaerella plurivora TaxID=936078 RepID=A0A9P9A5C1_9PEZI|nr:ankyrin repeat-containing domain protein [Plectosphaerella plurivora]
MGRNWEGQKAELTRLYIDEGKKLDDVMDDMERNFNFRASKRAYRFHFDRWGLQKYNCKKRNERKLQRQQQQQHEQQHLPPSPPDTTPSPYSAPMPSMHIKEEGGDGFDLDLSPNGEDYQDAFTARSLPASTGLAFSSTNLPYPGNLALSPMQTLMPSPGRTQHRPPPTPDPDMAGTGAGTHDHLAFGHTLDPFGTNGNLFGMSLETILLEAIRQHNAPQVRETLAQGCRLDISDAHGLFPIHTAARYGDPVIVRMVLQAGGDANHRDRLGQSPLYHAASLPVLDALLESNPPPNLSRKDSSGDTLLHHRVRDSRWCTDTARREMVYRILDHRSAAFGAADVNMPDAGNVTPFHMVLAQAEINLAALIVPLGRMLASNADAAAPIYDRRFQTHRLPLEILVGGLQGYIQARGNAHHALDERQWSSLDVLLCGFLDRSGGKRYPAQVLRVLLSQMLFNMSVCRLWPFVQRLVGQGMVDTSAVDEDGHTALHDVLLHGRAFVQVGGNPTGEERVTFLLRSLVGGMGPEGLRSAWQIYSTSWRCHRRFDEMMRLFADRSGAASRLPLRSWE